MKSPNPVGTEPTPNFRLGVACGLLSGVCLSTGGLALRYVESASGWQVLTYRAIAFIVMMGIVLGVRYRGNILTALFSVGAAGLVVAGLLGIGAICFVFAVLNTTVANVVLILSTSPLVTALLSRLLLGERHDSWTWMAMAAAVLGIAIMFGDGLDGGGYLGVAIAVAAVLSYGFMLVIMRFSKSRDMLPATALSGFVTLAIAYSMAVDLNISAWDAGIGVFLGVFQFGLGFVFITLAIRHLPAAHVALLSLSEVVLAPAWVWLGVGERPTTLGFAGGAIVLTAVAAQATRMVHRARAAGP